jgi:hypothetical protein
MNIILKIISLLTNLINKVFIPNINITYLPIYSENKQRLLRVPNKHTSRKIIATSGFI